MNEVSNCLGSEYGSRSRWMKWVIVWVQSIQDLDEWRVIVSLQGMVQDLDEWKKCQ